MTTLYRVFPWVEAARAGDPGHPLFVPGLVGGRVDNPDHYPTIYLSDGPGGACAEAFSYRPAWDAAMLRGSPSMPGSVRALGTYVLGFGDISGFDLRSTAIAVGGALLVLFVYGLVARSRA